MADKTDKTGKMGTETKTAYIFCKSFDLNMRKINIAKSGGNIYIAADSGLETAEKLKITPDIIIGDFDSAAPELLEKYSCSHGSGIIKYPPQKDDTDSMLCVKYAVERGFEDIVIIGGIGGRIDHTLANLALLRYIKNHGGSGIITDGFNRVSYIADGVGRVFKNYKYVSLIPVSRELRGVTLTGFLYNLENAVVRADEPYTISNEIDTEGGLRSGGLCGTVKITEGEAFICECD